jgi:hypothetical protein
MGEVQRGRGRGAGVLDVDDGRVAEAAAVERGLTADAVLAVERPLGRIGEHDRLGVRRRGPGVGERRARRLCGEVAEAAVEEAPEAGHADPDDAGFPHGPFLPKAPRQPAAFSRPLARHAGVVDFVSRPEARSVAPCGNDLAGRRPLNMSARQAAATGTAPGAG